MTHKFIEIGDRISRGNDLVFKREKKREENLFLIEVMMSKSTHNESRGHKILPKMVHGPS